MIQLSIITVNKNNVKGLEKTLSSVTNQSFTNFEYIVIDGGSTDGSIDIINKFQDKIAYSVSEKDEGVYEAMNKGIKKAKGQYLLFLNSGDYLVSNSVLENVFNIPFSEDIVYGSLHILHSDQTIEKGSMPETITFSHMIKDTLWHPVSFIKRTLFEQYGLYNQQFRIVADYDFFLKTIIVNKVSTKRIDTDISVFNLDGLSSKPENSAKLKEERKKAQLQYFLPAEIDNVYTQELKNKKSLVKRFLEKFKIISKK